MALLSNLIHCDSEAFVSACLHSSLLIGLPQDTFFPLCPNQSASLQQSNELRLLITAPVFFFPPLLWDTQQLLMFVFVMLKTQKLFHNN